MLTSLLYEMCVTKNHEQVSIGIRLITLVGPPALLYVTSPYFYLSLFIYLFLKSLI